MTLRWIPVGCVALLAAACSDQRARNAEEEAEWAEIQALADDSARPGGGASALATEADEEVSTEQFEGLIRKLEAMKRVRRGKGETLLTGDALTLDYDAGLVRMERDAVVEDDQGVLKADRFEGRFSLVAGRPELERFEAVGHVDAVSGERKVRADRALYDHGERLLLLAGAARASETTNSIAADRVRVWLDVRNQFQAAKAEGAVVLRHGEVVARGDSGLVDGAKEYARLEGRASIERGTERATAERMEVWMSEGARKVVCAPNVVLTGAAAAFELKGLPAATNELTEIRCNQLVYSEAAGAVDLVGSVRLRDPRAAMNSDALRINLKDGGEIDWIEARGGVIIQIGGIKGLPPGVEYVRALAGRATYWSDAGRFALEEEPKVKAGANVMTGRGIECWVAPWRMVCKPNARVLLELDAETKEKFMKDLGE